MSTVSLLIDTHIAVERHALTPPLRQWLGALLRGRRSSIIHPLIFEQSASGLWAVSSLLLIWSGAKAGGLVP